jgi:methyl acetate hydrolase
VRGLPQIDRVLQTATDRGDVPGVVAMAGRREGPVYQGAYGTRTVPEGAPMIGMYCQNSPPPGARRFRRIGRAEASARPMRPITLRHLITHTAGFAYDIWCSAMGRYTCAARRFREGSLRGLAIAVAALSFPITGSLAPGRAGSPLPDASRS